MPVDVKFEFKIWWTADSAWQQADAHTLNARPAALGEYERKLNELGKEGWHIAGVGVGWIYLQRMVLPDPPAQPEREAEDPDAPAGADEQVDPLCGCGCGESVVIPVRDWERAMAEGKVFYRGSHGPGALSNPGPYAAEPLRRRNG